MREALQNADEFAELRSVPLRGQGLTITLGRRRRGAREELVAVEGRLRQVEAALELFREFHGFDAEAFDVETVPDGTPAVLVRLGELQAVVYRSDKWDGKARDYIHETRRPRPELCSTPDGRQLVLLGGAVRVAAEGLVG